MRTVTVPCSMPVGTTRGKIRITSCGRASVVTSQSLTLLPTRRSRTHPPTIHARFPASRSRAQSATASRSMRATSVGRSTSELTFPRVYHARAVSGALPTRPGAAGRSYGARSLRPGIYDFAAAERRCRRCGFGRFGSRTRRALAHRQPHEVDLDLLFSAIENDGLRLVSLASYFDAHFLSGRHVDGDGRRAEIVAVLKYVRVERLGSEEHVPRLGGGGPRRGDDGRRRRRRDHHLWRRAWSRRGS